MTGLLEANRVTESEPTRPVPPLSLTAGAVKVSSAAGPKYGRTSKQGKSDRGNEFGRLFVGDSCLARHCLGNLWDALWDELDDVAFAGGKLCLMNALEAPLETVCFYANGDSRLGDERVRL